MSPRRRTKARYELGAEAPLTMPASAPPSPPPATAAAAVAEVAPAPAVAEVAPASEPPAAPPTEAVRALPVPEAEAPADEVLPRRRHRVSSFFIMLGLALLAFLTGLLVFNSLVMPRLIHGIGQVEVPDVRNLTLDQAEQALRPYELQISRAGERFDPAVPRGFVLSQDPAPGTAVRGRRRVSVVVSLGEEFSSIPELFGESQRSAEQLLRSAGLRLGAITRAPSDDVGAELVAGSDPGPESVLPQGSPVSLLVSTGSGEESFVMPDLVGREISGVRRQLEGLGFHVTTPFGGPAVGSIVLQRPPAGSRITPATEISLQATGRMIR